jgi:hypothetical protein
LHEVILLIIDLSVGPHQADVTVELSRKLVDAGSQFELDCLQVDWSRYLFVVVWGSISNLVYRLEKREDLSMGF